MFFLPEVGDEVLVGFEHGEMEHPFVLGSLWNGQAKPPIDNTDEKSEVRVARTRSGSELRFIETDKLSVEINIPGASPLPLVDFLVPRKRGILRRTKRKESLFHRDTRATLYKTEKYSKSTPQGAGE